MPGLGPAVHREHLPPDQDRRVADGVVALLVDQPRAETEALLARVAAGHQVIDLEAGLDRAETDLRFEAMPGGVQVAVVVAEAEAPQGVGRVADARTPCMARCGVQRHVDRDDAGLGLVARGTDLDPAEVAAVAQDPVDADQAARVERLARLHRDQAAHELGRQRMLAEAHFAERIADAAVGLQHDLCRGVLRVDAQLLAGEAEVEIPALGGQAVQA